MKVMNYWQHKGKKVEDPNFDAKAFRHTSRNMKLGLARWAAKWHSGICGVGKWLERWKEQEHSKCPRCLQSGETVEHVLQCQHEDATQVWNSGLEELRMWILSNNAIPELAEALILRLAQWRNQQPLTELTHTNDQVKEIIMAQDSVGWAPFCFGTLHKE